MKVTLTAITLSKSDSETSKTATASSTTGTATSSQSETNYEANNEGTSSRESSREGSLDLNANDFSINCAVRILYSALLEMAIIHPAEHGTIHAVKDKHQRSMARNFFQQ